MACSASGAIFLAVGAAALTGLVAGRQTPATATPPSGSAAEADTRKLKTRADITAGYQN